MTWKILAVGRPSLAFARDGIADYLGRLRHVTRIEEHFVKARPDSEARLLEHSDGHFRILLDERGRQFTSRAFAAEIQRLENQSRVALLVGGADGWSDATRSKANLLWSLGSLTLQHELALVIALEQIYRAYAINAGLPYHRD
ncbi:MAG: 23S rRNA (pseudouridine(1915)-N(3))-methyltransferase RlmH [Terrimicrobiaceae bacterium]|nr:23S rRNA (pseudouridine(1915)-N(3))-methyltransferase RlmH [Terrimicrobiaceae bacterium]